MTAIRAITRVQDADDVTLAGAANNDPIVYDSSTGGMKKGTAGSADKLGLTPTAVKTAGYTAAAGDLVPVDTTSGAVTVTLPTAPTDGTVIGIKHVIQGGTNAVTYATGGSDVINKASGATSGTLPTLAQGVLLQYKSSSAIWYVVANDIALSQLDSRYWPQTSLLGAGVYGDGSDGTVTFDGSTTILGMAPSSSVYTLTRDFFFAAATINSGVQIKTNGFRIVCSGAITGVDATSIIQWNGIPVTAGTNKSAAGGQTGNSNGSISNSSTMGTAGGSGATGAGSGATNQASVGMGGAGGVGGTGTGGAGGAGGTVAAQTANRQYPRSAPAATEGLIVVPGGSPVSVFGGAGGGGGGGDTTNPGGGGGGGAGTVVVSAKTFAGTGAIQARGGNAGTPTVGNCGGGGGGGGGTVVVVSQSVSGGAISGWTIDANGGTKGTPSGTGTNNAANGNNGTVVLVPN